MIDICGIKNENKRMDSDWRWELRKINSETDGEQLYIGGGSRKR